MPLDLHVLSLSLAFILSQDQTLHCYYKILFLSLRSDYYCVYTICINLLRILFKIFDVVMSIYKYLIPLYYLSKIVLQYQYVYDLFFLHPKGRFRPKGSAKLKTIFFTSKSQTKIYFRSELKSNRLSFAVAKIDTFFNSTIPIINFFRFEGVRIFEAHIKYMFIEKKLQVLMTHGKNNGFIRFCLPNPSHS